jgi:predicted aconitase
LVRPTPARFVGDLTSIKKKKKEGRAKRKKKEKAEKNEIKKRERNEELTNTNKFCNIQPPPHFITSHLPHTSASEAASTYSITSTRRKNRSLALQDSRPYP